MASETDRTESPAADGDAAPPGTGSAGDTVDGAGVEARLDDALERVAHGATVSIPAIVFRRGLALAFVATLTNGFTAPAYGLFALSRRFQRVPLRLALGFRAGLSRYLPTAESPAEREAILTVASALLVGTAGLLGLGVFVAAPAIAATTGSGARFVLYLRVFAVGLPASVWLFAVAGMLRGLEEVGAMTLLLRVGFPVAQLVVGVVGVLLADLVAVAVGVVVTMGAAGVAGAVWLASARGLRPVRPAVVDRTVVRRYLRYTLPLFVLGVPTVVQRLGFYPLIALFLTDTAGGVFAVGVLLGSLVRLPLMGTNQFISPVAAALHERGHRDALRRLYHVTSRLVLVGTTALLVPLVVYRRTVLSLFGAAFVAAADLLPGFLLGQWLAAAAGSVGILLTMTDHGRALLVVNTCLTLALAAVAVPLTDAFGLPGLVAAYLLMLAANNGLEVLVLYRLEGLQPFTRRHATPLVAAVPLAAVTLATRATLPGAAGVLVGVSLGLVAYAWTVRALGFSTAERRVAATLVDRYRDRLGGG